MLPYTNALYLHIQHNLVFFHKHCRERRLNANITVKLTEVPRNLTAQRVLSGASFSSCVTSAQKNLRPLVLFNSNTLVSFVEQVRQLSSFDGIFINFSRHNATKVQVVVHLIVQQQETPICQAFLEV